MPRTYTCEATGEVGEPYCKPSKRLVLKRPLPLAEEPCGLNGCLCGMIGGTWRAVTEAEYEAYRAINGPRVAAAFDGILSGKGQPWIRATLPEIQALLTAQDEPPAEPKPTALRVTLAGRTDTEDYFAKSGVLRYKKLAHTPFLAFVPSDTGVEVKIIPNADKLLELPNETPVMGQWMGEWRSDIFQFTVGDVRQHMGR